MILNVSFGVYILHPIGWAIISIILAIEYLTIRKILSPVVSNVKVLTSVLVANIISGLFGLVASMYFTSGLWTLLWLPWVGTGDVLSSELFPFICYFLIALVLTIIIEWLVYKRRFKKQSNKTILKLLLLSNLFSYCFSVAMYLVSFGVIN